MIPTHTDCSGVSNTVEHQTYYTCGLFFFLLAVFFFNFVQWLEPEQEHSSREFVLHAFKPNGPQFDYQQHICSPEPARGYF